MNHYEMNVDCTMKCRIMTPSALGTGPVLSENTGRERLPFATLNKCVSYDKCGTFHILKHGR